MVLRILGHNYLFTYESNGECYERQLRGVWGGMTRTIKIDATIAPQLQCETMIHEFVEAVNYHLSINLTHEQISQINSGLWAIIADNWEFIRDTFEKAIKYDYREGGDEKD